jgi:hypothetical protein
LAKHNHKIQCQVINQPLVWGPWATSVRSLMTFPSSVLPTKLWSCIQSGGANNWCFIYYVKTSPSHFLVLRCWQTTDTPPFSTHMTKGPWYITAMTLTIATMTKLFSKGGGMTTYSDKYH